MASGAARLGPHRSAYEKNRKRILAEQHICGICGRPVNKSLKFPDPLSATVDHIIPFDRGGHPSAYENLQLAHLCCNRQKSNKLIIEARLPTQNDDEINNRDLPQSRDWSRYRPGP